jgi:aldehyde:ferredoxin oxidoreductase
VDDLSAIEEANRLCGEYGLDTISAGATIACAMELGERGRLGRALHFGDGDRLVEMVKEMGQGYGFGAELADGSARFAARYRTSEAAIHGKGLELPAYDPRGMMGQGLAYATSNRGACHLRGNMLGPEVLGIPKLLDRREPAGKSGILMHLQHLSAAYDSACVCKFVGFAYGEELLARLMQAATGEQMGAEDLLRAGERVWTLERLWNLAAGFTRADDTLPARLLIESAAGTAAQPAYTQSAARAGGTRPAPPSKGLPLDAMLNEYYRARGWSSEGVPGERKLDFLGLQEQAVRLKEHPGPPLPGREGQGWRPDWMAAAAEAKQGPPRPDPDSTSQRPRNDGGRHLQAV